MLPLSAWVNYKSLWCWTVEDTLFSSQNCKCNSSKYPCVVGVFSLKFLKLNMDFDYGFKLGLFNLLMVVMLYVNIKKKLN